MNITNAQQRQPDALAEAAVQIVAEQAVAETVEALVAAGYARDIVLQAAFGQIIAGLAAAFGYDVARGVCERMISLIEQMEMEARNGH